MLKNQKKLLELFKQNRTWTLAQLTNKLPSMNRSTIFRNIKKMVYEQTITEVHVHDKATHFELAERSKHHDHLLCNNCHTAECVPCPVPQLKNHSLELTGQCSLCVT